MRSENQIRLHLADGITGVERIAHGLDYSWNRLCSFWEMETRQTVDVWLFRNQEQLKRETGYDYHHANIKSHAVYQTCSASPGHEFNHILISMLGRADRCAGFEEAAACALDLRRTRTGADLRAVMSLAARGAGGFDPGRRSDLFGDGWALISFAYHVLDALGARSFRDLVLFGGPELSRLASLVEADLQLVVDAWYERIRMMSRDRQRMLFVLEDDEPGNAAARADEARELMSRYGETPELALRLGHAYRTRGDLERARAAFSSGLRSRCAWPMSLRVRERLLRALAHLGQACGGAGAYEAGLAETGRR